jgi:putative Mg2+ transporter-C (MgtC) family protein
MDAFGWGYYGHGPPMHQLDIVWRLGLALLLSSAIGVEREMRQKTAGLRTYTLVGVGSALFMLVSIFGFADGAGLPHVSLDPSRVAAQIVSGIGFIGGGIIFVRRDIVRGLTTAAGVWVTAAVGMACGGDLPVLAVATTLVYFVVAYMYPALVRRLRRSRDAPSDLRLVYLDGHGILRAALAECVRRGFSISDLSIKHDGTLDRGGYEEAVVTVELEVRGRGPLSELATELNEIDGIVDVHAGDANALSY